MSIDAAPEPGISVSGPLSGGQIRRLRNLIHELHIATGELITLSTPNDLFMQLFDFSGTPRGDETTQRGFGISTIGSVIGTAYLSILSEAEIARLLDRARIKPAEAPAIQESIALTRREGVADGEALGGVAWSVAAPFPAGSSPVPLVLGLSGARNRVYPRRQELRALLSGLVDGWKSSQG